MVVCQWQTVSSAPVHLRLMLGPEQVLWKSLAYGWNNYHAHQTTGWPLVLGDNAPTRAEMNYGIELINLNSNASGAQCESAAWCQTDGVKPPRMLEEVQHEAVLPQCQPVCLLVSRHFGQEWIAQHLLGGLPWNCGQTCSPEDESN